MCNTSKRSNKKNDLCTTIPYIIVGWRLKSVMLDVCGYDKLTPLLKPLWPNSTKLLS